MSRDRSAHQWKVVALATALGGVTLILIGLSFLFVLDQQLVGAILTGVGAVDLMVAMWFARRAAGED